MNDLIQELLLKVHSQTKGGIYSGHLSEWTEKFAKLIVQESATVIQDLVDRRIPASEYSSRLKSHFGVEDEKHCD